MLAASEERLRQVPWEALRGRAAALDAPLAAILSGSPADAILSRHLRGSPALDASGRAAVAEALFGVALWRRRLVAQLGLPAAAPRLLLAALLRDLAGREDAALLVGLSPEALPAPRAPPVELADRFSLPGWLDRELHLAAGASAAALADALDLPGPVCLRPNLLRTSPAALAARLAEEGVATRPGTLMPSSLVVVSPRPNVYGLAAHREGLFEVQDEASQLAGALAGARPGETALDLCAGAGGKTLLLAAAVGPGGRVHASDRDGARLARLRDRASRAGAASIVLVDGAGPPADLLADRVLVDAPCSELGVLRRGPDLRWRIDPATFEPLPGLQREILARGARHVRPGGTLAYVTCTFRREEDEEVALAFEAAHPAFVRRLPPQPGTAASADGFVRTWPHVHGTDAFFVAVWERRGQ